MTLYVSLAHKCFLKYVWDLFPKIMYFLCLIFQRAIFFLLCGALKLVYTKSLIIFFSTLMGIFYRLVLTESILNILATWLCELASFIMY